VDIKNQKPAAPIEGASTGLNTDNSFLAERAANAAPAPTPENPFTKSGPSLFDAISESFLLANTEANLASWASKAGEQAIPEDPNFNAYRFAREQRSDPRVANITSLLVEDEGDRLSRVKSEGDFWRVVDQLNGEIERTKTAGSHGIVPMLLGSAAGIALSPTDWGVAAATGGAGTAVKLGLTAKRAAALRGAMVGLTTAGVNDAAMEANQELHTAADSFLNLGLGTAIGGFAGRYIGLEDALNPARTSEARATHPLNPYAPDDSLHVPGTVSAADVLEYKRTGQMPDSVGASASPAVEGGPTRAAKGGRLGFLDNMTPVGRAIKRGELNDTDFGIMSKLIEVPVETEANRAFVPTGASAELTIRLYESSLLLKQEDVAKAYRELAVNQFGESKLGTITKNLFGQSQDRVTWEQFNLLVSRYRRAQALGKELPLDDAIKPYVARAAEAEGKFYSGWADELEKHGLLTKEERQEFYLPQVYNRRAVTMFTDEFRDLLRQALRASPPEEFLEARGFKSLEGMSPTDKQLVLDDWVNTQKDDLMASAEAALKDASARLAESYGASKRLKEAGRSVERQHLRELLRGAREAETQRMTQRQKRMVEREEAVAEYNAMQRAYDAGIAAENARAVQQVRELPDTGARELAAFEKASAASDKAQATLPQRLFENRQVSREQIDELNAALTGKKQEADAAFAKATEQPVTAKPAPQPELTISVAKAEERLKAANKRLGEIDRELARLDTELETIRYNRSWTEKKLEDLAVARREIAAAARRVAKERKAAAADKEKAQVQITKAETFVSVEDRINDIVDRIAKGKDVPNGILNEIVPGTGRLKERKIDWGEMILDPRVEKFLINDAEVMSVRYHADVAPRASFRKVFGNDTDDQLSGSLRELRESWKERIEAAPAGERDKLVALRDQAVQDFSDMRDKLLGRLGLPDNPNSALMWMNRTVRNVNVSRLMGMALLSSLTDVATGVLATRRSFAWVPLFGKRISKIAEQMPDRELRSLMLSVEQAQYTNRMSRSMMVEDSIMDAGGFGTGGTYKLTAAIDRGMSFLSRNTNTLSGLGAWTSRLRFIFGSVQIDNMSRELARWGTLSEKRKAGWARLGVSEEMAGRIAKQLDKHAEKINGVTVTNGKAWTDTDAYLAFERTLVRSMDEALINPGAGDVPTFMSKPMGKLLMQFMSFAFASQNRYTRLAWQQRDLNALTSVTMGMSLGLLGYVVREYAKGTNEKGETASDRIAKRKPGDFFYEAFTRSPIPGSLSVGSDFLMKLAARPVQDALGIDLFTGPSRLRERGAFTTLLGPTYGLLENLNGAVSAALDAPSKGFDPVIAKGAKLLPYSNLLPLLAISESADEALFGR
jgi:hypothetical protein